MPSESHVVALSGGKDSTAMALRLRELHPDVQYQFVCTPTGNELPEMVAHWERLGELLGTPIVKVTAGVSLIGMILNERVIPSWRMRWCTRVLKIQPFQAYVLEHCPAVTYVGIRADEVEDREGVDNWGENIEARFPLVEWGWGIGDVTTYLKANDVVIPQRTDCALCFFQTLSEWHTLYKEHPDLFQQGIDIEECVWHTFRSPGRDFQPTALRDLRSKFNQGYTPKPQKMSDRKVMCAVCAR